MSALALGPVGESDELRSRRGWEFRGMHCGNPRAVVDEIQFRISKRTDGQALLFIVHLITSHSGTTSGIFFAPLR